MTEPLDPMLLDVIKRLRAICLELPEAYEEDAWVGVRWRIRQRTIGHVRMVQPDLVPQPAVYAMLPKHSEPLCVMTFRSPSPEYEALIASGYPFYRPDWGEDVVGMVFDDDTDWDEVRELLTESYCRLAPKKLIALLGLEKL